MLLVNSKLIFPFPFSILFYLSPLSLSLSLHYTVNPGACSYYGGQLMRKLPPVTMVTSTPPREKGGYNSERERERKGDKVREIMRERFPFSIPSLSPFSVPLSVAHYSSTICVCLYPCACEQLCLPGRVHCYLTSPGPTVPC